MARTINVVVRKPRPDFRVFIDLLYPAGGNVDTDGDAVPVFKRDWRYLYMRAREEGAPAVLLHAEAGDPLVFEVESACTQLQELAAVYLQVYCGETIAIDGSPVSGVALRALQQAHSLELERAASSVWHQSSAENPYPSESDT